MEELATSLLSTLKRSSAPVETKLSLLNSLKSSIKHQRIPESAQPASIECIRIAIATQTSSSLVTAGFATLGHLIKRLIIQDQTNILFSPRANLLPLLLERFGDAREFHRASASQALCDLWPVRQVDIENLIKNDAISSSTPRLKEAGMDWVTKMHATHQLQFRSFVPLMVECLEDAESTVRESAKGNIITLFTDARDAAKADLKRQLIAQNIRKSIMSFILSQLQIPVPSDTKTVGSQIANRPEVAKYDQAVAETPATTLNSSTTTEVTVEPLYVQSQRELEDMFREMGPCFEDKETEDNWKARDTNVTKMRRLLQGNAPAEHHQVLVASIKSLLDGILKVANSLRTTMSTNGCQLIQELAKILGASLDPMVELILHGLEKMSASTKHISGQNADLTIDTIYSRVSYHIRLVQHIWYATQDKNVQPRALASGWLKTLLKRQLHNRAQFESSGGLELADKSIRKGLIDPNPKVREAMRGTYWLFAQGWPERSEAIMTTLDAKSKQLLLKDPGNPNATAGAASFTTSVGPSAAPNPRAAPSTSRTSLKETIAAQKKAALLAAKKVPERPSSAMSSFSPVRQPPPSAVRPVAPPPPVPQARVPPPPDSNSSTRPPLTSTASSSGGLLSAPMRRPKRPEITRPATADVYATKRNGRAITPPRSPAGNAVTNDVKSPGAKSTTSNPEATAPKAFDRTSRFTSPRLSPARSMQQLMYKPKSATTPQPAAPCDSGSRSPINEENMTMVIPFAGPLERAFVSQSSFSHDNEPASFDRFSMPATAEEDNFTMVIFDKAPVQTERMPEVKKADPHADTLSFESNDVVQQNIIQEDGVVAIDFGVHAGGDAKAMHMTKNERPNEEDLIVFEDPTADDVMAPVSEEAQRSALEEVHVNAQLSAPHIEPIVSGPPEENIDERPVSPTKGKLVTQQPFEDRAETLKLRRLVRSGVDRIRARTLDIYGFRRLEELIAKIAKSDEQLTIELLGALIEFIYPSKAVARETSNHNLESQALACMRTAVRQPISYNKTGKLYADALYALIMAAGTCEKTGLYAHELDKTADEMIRLPQGIIHVYLEQLLQHDWRRSGPETTVHTRVLTALLVILTKILEASLDNGEKVISTDQTQLYAIAVQCLEDIDAEVRKAGTEFCLVVYKAFGKDSQTEYWKVIRTAGEGQMNLVAYYLAKKKWV